jgi:hypothetical protein
MDNHNFFQRILGRKGRRKFHLSSQPFKPQKNGMPNGYLTPSPRLSKAKLVTSPSCPYYRKEKKCHCWKLCTFKKAFQRHNHLDLCLVKSK